MKKKQEKESVIQLIHLDDQENPFKEIKQMDMKNDGFVCNMKTGVCGPIIEKKEGK